MNTVDIWFNSRYYILFSVHLYFFFFLSVFLHYKIIQYNNKIQYVFDLRQYNTCVISAIVRLIALDSIAALLHRQLIKR